MSTRGGNWLLSCSHVLDLLIIYLIVDSCSSFLFVVLGISCFGDCCTLSYLDSIADCSFLFISELKALKWGINPKYVLQPVFDVVLLIWKVPES